MGQRGDFTGLVCPYLEDDHLGLGWRRQKRKGESDLIVLIRPGGMDDSMRLEDGLEEGPRRGLPYGPCDPNDPHTPFAEVRPAIPRELP
jgi:hypothetical protein